MADIKKVNASDISYDIKDAFSRKGIAVTSGDNEFGNPHSAGFYFWYNNTLYVTIDVVAAGDIILPGENCREALLGQDVTTSKSSVANISSGGIFGSAHAAGHYFWVDNTLYITTTSVSAGETIKPDEPNKNCEPAKLGSDVATLKRKKLDAPSVAGTNGQALISDGNGGQSWQTPYQGEGSVRYDEVQNLNSAQRATVRNNIAAAPRGSLANAPFEGVFANGHSAGFYFWLDGGLYKTTTSVTSGTTAIPGTNCEAAQLGPDVEALISSVTNISFFDNVFNAPCPAGYYFWSSGKLYKTSIAVSAGAPVYPGYNCDETWLGSDLYAIDARVTELTGIVRDTFLQLSSLLSREELDQAVAVLDAAILDLSTIS